MATFKVGQRVRIVCSLHVLDGQEATVSGVVSGRRLRYKTGLMEGPFPVMYRLRVGDLTNFPDGRFIAALPSELAPLTDPGCESFLQAMRDYASKQRTPVDVLRELHGEYL
jgi:hypothetical protein